MNDQINPKKAKHKWLSLLWLTLAAVVVAGILYLVPQQMQDMDGNLDTRSLIEKQSDESTSSSSQTKTFTGMECDSTLEAYCSSLNTRDWMTWCESQIESWRDVGVEAINPCANSKYAKDSCMEAAIANHKAGITGYENVSQACMDYHVALNTSSANVQEMCLYTTKRGGVCEGIKPAPVKPGTKPEDVVVPLDDCLKENYETLTEACQDALDFHTDVSRSSTR